MTDKRRWYDRDPVLKEALELLSISTEDTKDQASRFILKLQEEVAADVIERVYQTITKFQGTGNRWYDEDPVMMKAIEFLRIAPPHVQRFAAAKLIKAIAREDFGELDFNEASDTQEEDVIDE